jgi:cytochrome c553
VGPMAPRMPYRFSKLAGRRAVALQFATVAVLAGTSAYAETATDRPVPKEELKAKITYCENCHGASAQGFHGYYPIPRLAGQQPDYIKNQLEAFVEHRRTNNIMFSVAHVLRPAMLDALTESFQNLNPKPLATPAAQDLIAAGKKLYDEGIANTDVPPCAGCHGPDAKGNGQFPRLAGQLSDYIVDKLTNWAKERGQNPGNPDASAIMAPIAHSLNQQQIKAVAVYLNHVE